MRRSYTAAPIALAAAGLIASGCGSNNDSSSSSAAAPANPATTTAATPAPSDPGALDATGGSATITAKDLSFSTKKIDAKAGKLKVKLDNDGKAPHEFVVIKTADAPDKLPTKGGGADEKGSVGEIEETKGGTSASHEFDLKPGHYVFICNVPGHYTAGMNGEIDVK